LNENNVKNNNDLQCFLKLFHQAREIKHQITNSRRRNTILVNRYKRMRICQK
jgi:hypothetical protein